MLEKEHMSRGEWQGREERERERENVKQGLRSGWSPTWGLILLPWDHELSHNQESDAQPPEPLGCL